MPWDFSLFFCNMNSTHVFKEIRDSMKPKCSLPLDETILKKAEGIFLLIVRRTVLALAANDACQMNCDQNEGFPFCSSAR